MFKQALIALATTAALASPAMAANTEASFSAAPAMIAETVPFTKSLAPAKSLSQHAGSSTETVVSKPGAAFIKVHFSYFNIPQGAYVTVSDASGQEVYMYDGKNNEKMTFNTVNGENGQTQFSAMSVFGEQAIVRLVVPAGAKWEKRHGIKIDSFKAGTDSSDQVFKGTKADFSTRSTCGVNERRDVACWQNSHPTEYERTRPVARLLMNGSGLCTGWRVGNDNRMFTNEHCVGSQSELTNTEVWFNYQATSCNGTVNSSQTIKVTGAQLLESDYDLDYTLFTVNNFANIQSFGNFGLDVRTPTQGERIYIPQHGSGNPKELAIESDQNSSGLCEIDVAIEAGRAAGTDTGYMCDTIGGSSGSPVLAANSNKVIALHHFGGCTNQGVRMDLIWPQVSSHFGGSIPVGDNNGTPGNQAPIAQAAVNCNGLSCTLNGSGSSDSDGNITAYSWSISDGTNLTGANASHTFAGNGNYTVTLTVTDDDGATGSTTENVSVNDGSGNVLVSGVPVSLPALNTGSDVVYTIDTTENNTTTTVEMSGGSGDADLYVRRGAAPSDSTYDCRPYRSGNNETCTVNSGTPNTVYVRVKAYSSFSGVSVTATNTTSTPSGYPKTGLSGSNQAIDYHTYTPSAAGTVTVSISGGTGDADLYTRKNAQPTTSTYDCRPYRSGNNESCSVSLAASDVLHIGLRAYSNYSGVTLDVQ